MSQPTRVIIIGAGWSGLVAAKTYLQISKLLNRPIDLIVLDESSDVGGVWSTSRLYPGLMANSPNGLYEYSDFTMADSDHPSYQLIPGDRVQKYLEAYARNFDVYRRIRFSIKVIKVRKEYKSATSPSEWIIETDRGEFLKCDKLIIATGLYSKPYIPPIPMSKYTGKILHSRSLGKECQSLIEDPKIKNIAVIGGCKSSIEACSIFLSSNNKKQVSWIIRPSSSGTGVPILIANPNMIPNFFAANQTRLFNIFSPSPFIDLKNPPFWYKFLHSGKSKFGTFIQSLFFSFLSWFILTRTQYDKSENGKKIKPEGNLFFKIGNISTLTSNHPFLKWLHQDNPEILKVYRGKVIKLEGKDVFISEGDDDHLTQNKIKADVIIFCTGWKKNMFDLFEDEELKSLSNHTDPTSLIEADQKTEDFYPLLRSNPSLPLSLRDQSTNDIKLYKQILPLSLMKTEKEKDKRNLIFTGLLSTSQTAITSELMSIWGISWLENILSLSKQKNLQDIYSTEKEILLINSWMKYRYGLKGIEEPTIILEIQTYLDQLCQDLNVDIYRKRKKERKKESSWWWSRAIIPLWFYEWCTPYVSSDYAGVVEEVVKNYLNRVDEPLKVGKTC